VPADLPLQLTDLAASTAFRISPGDTVKLAPLRDPDGLYDVSMFLEICELGGAQPPNSHPRSVETFLFLKGEGMAYCDEESVPVRSGALLVLPPRSLHRIVNTGEQRLYAITTMYPDDGFAALVRRGTSEALTAEDLAVLHRSLPESGPRPGPAEALSP
jgi:mannose-6-phosphate isomerase-like protein (cupin superfamily)